MQMQNSKSAYAVSYLRVSDPSQLRGESPEDQKTRITLTAERIGCTLWPNGQVFIEAYSGRKTSRPVYDDLIARIKKAKKKGFPIKYFIIRGIDRFTRGGAADYEKMKGELTALGVELIDSYGVIQPRQNTLSHLGFSYDWSVYSPSETAEVIEATRSKQEVREILTRMISAEIQLTQKGYKIRQASDGYVNKKVETDKRSGKHAVIQVPDPERAEYFATIFDLRAKGTLSDQEITDKVNAMGFLTKQQRRWNHNKSQIIGYTQKKPLTVKRMQKIVMQPIYAGVVCEKWTNYLPIKASYPGLVSIELFNKANRGKIAIEEYPDGSLEIVKDVERRRRLLNNPEFRFKNVVRCPVCNKQLLGSSSRGKSGKYFPAYHCSRGHKRFSAPKKKLDEVVLTLLDSLQFSEEFLEKLTYSLIYKYRSREAELAKYTAQVNQSVADLELEKSELLQAFTKAQTGIVRESLEQKVTEVDLRIKRTRKQRTLVELKEDEIYRFVDTARKIMEHPAKLFGNPSEIEKQRTFFSLIFRELPTYEEVRNGTPKFTEIFKLHNAFFKSRSEKSLMVGLQSVEWNTLAREIKEWLSVWDQYGLKVRTQQM